MQRILLIIIYLFTFLFTVPAVIHAQVKTVAPALETSNCRNTGDVCDDSAIWIHPTDPSQSVVIGDDKNGGMLVWDLQGKELQYIDSSLLMNNVDIRYNFPLQGTYSTGQAHSSVALVIVGAENAGALQVYKMNPSTRKLENVSQIKLSISAPYGGCMYHSPVSNKFYYFVNWKSGVWQQIELTTQGGTVTGTSVRTADAGGQTEGCVADDVHKYFYIGEEAVGVHRYGAEPGDGSTRVKVSGSEQAADTEGMSMYYKSDDTGYLIVSSQGDSTFSVYNRIPPSNTQPNALIGKFQVGANGAVDAVSSTDGLDVTNFALGSAFPQGLLVVHDASNGGTSNHKFVPFQNVASQLGLSMDTSWDPRKVGGSGGGGGGGGGGTTPTIPVATPTVITPTNNTNVTIPPGSNCAKKNIGDANCQTDPHGRSIDIFDYAIWYSEAINGCTGSDLAKCGSDADGNGNAMDANFNYPGTNYISTDTIVNSFDYAVWIQGLLSQSNSTSGGTPLSPTSIANNPTAVPTLTPTGNYSTTPTAPIPTFAPGTTKGLWLSKEEIMKLPMSGAAWEQVKADASSNWGSADLSSLTSYHDTSTLAGALVAVRTGDAAMRQKVVAALQSAQKSQLARALELSRNLQSYIFAADIIGYDDPSFKTWVRNMINANVTPHNGGDSLCNTQGTKLNCSNIGGVKCTALVSPSNWGNHARAAMVAAGLYLNDAQMVNEAANAYRSFIGESVANHLNCNSTSWHANSTNRYGINKKGALISGKNVSGVLPEDWRRGAEFKWPPAYSNYMWGGMNGLVVTSVVLHRAGIVPITSGDNAVIRAMDMLYGQGEAASNSPVVKFSPEGDDTWIPWVVNYYTGKNYPTTAAGIGKSMGYTDWSHSK